MSKPSALALKRGGFTIIELLIVVAIIAVLLGLGIGAAFKVIDAQRSATTEDLLRTVDKTLHTHWTFVVTDAKKEQPSPAVLALANGDENRAKVLWIKLRLAEAFPQSYADVIGAVQGQGVYGSGPNGPWIEPERRKYTKTYYDTIKLAKNANATPQAQSSVCLLVALSVTRGGAKLDQTHLTSSIADTDNDGLKELIDSWGRPITFRRFPIDPVSFPDFIALNPRANAAQAGFGDPLDPEGLLQQGDWYKSSNGTTFAAIFTPPHAFPAGNPQPYWVPFVSSDGRDETPGTTDDILSFRLRVGDRGD